LSRLSVLDALRVGWLRMVRAAMKGAWAMFASLVMAAALGGCSGGVTTHEVIVTEDERVDVSAGTVLTVVWPEADGSDEAHYSARCDDFGGRFTVRWVDGVGTAHCVGVDF
jgi:hypothetical protein